MNLLEHIPAVVKILLVLAFIVSGLRFKLHLGLSLIIGSLFLSFFFTMTPANYIKAVFAGIVSLETISLVLIVVGILILSNGMSLAGRLNRIVESFKRLVGESRITLITFPALIGLLPMPGGAIFSAPMVGAMSQNSPLQPHHKTAINYWFRHIWEFWWPLYPGVILALSLTKISPWQFILLNSPMTFIALATGYLLLLRYVTLAEEKKRDFSRQNIHQFLAEVAPILTLIFSLIIFSVLLNYVERRLNTRHLLIERLPIFLGLILSFGWIIVADKLSWLQVRSILLKKSVLEFGLLVFGIMIFKSVLEKCGGVVMLKNELLNYNIPILALIMALPFIAGLVTGIAVAFVGTAFPVIIPLINSGVPIANKGALIFIAYVMGWVGMMLCPVHICLLLTRDYFKASLFKVYIQYLLPVSYTHL
ncbi:MAG: DUF401 family protein, partial [Candidatus Sumerlaeia bacterium]|nr:DUF401 family protein [Candidatus Sumerlaeia bacterium]